MVVLTDHRRSMQVLLVPPEGSDVGARVCLAGLEPAEPEAAINDNRKKNTWEKASEVRYGAPCVPCVRPLF